MLIANAPCSRGIYYPDSGRRLHDAVAEGRPHKTTLEDSLADLRLFSKVARRFDP